MQKLNLLKQTGVALAVAQSLVINTSSAATINVNSGIDNGFLCTFRDAVETINAGSDQSNQCSIDTSTGELGVNDRIVFGSSLISLTAGEVLIESDVSINPGGNAVTIDVSASDRSRVLNINNAIVSLENTTLTGGNYFGFGGGIFANSFSTVTLINSTVTDNFAYFGGGIFLASSTLAILGSSISENTVNGFGGGIEVISGTATLINSHVSNNSADNSGGGIFANSSSELFIFGSDVSNNSANSGGGIDIRGNSELSIGLSTVSGNSTMSSIGGISILDSSATIDDSTVFGNSSDIGSSAISVAVTGGASASDSSSLVLSNSTVSGNSGPSFGAIQAGGSSVNGGSTAITLINSTVSKNVATEDGPPGIYASISSTLTLVNSIVAGNSGGMSSADITAPYAGRFNAAGNNVLGDSSKISAEAFIGVSPSNNNIIATSDGNRPTPITGILAPLSDNGGLTQTHALATGSPAVDAGDNAVCAAAPINNLDQRREPRPVGANCDIGAFEGEVEPDTTFFVVPLPNGKSVIFGL